MLERADDVGRLSVEKVSTATVDPEMRFDLWRKQVRRTCGNLRVLVDREHFDQGSITTSFLGGARMAVISADPHTVVLPWRHADTEQSQMYVATLARGFCRLQQDGTDVSIRPGQVVSFDASRPYLLSMREPSELVTLRGTRAAFGLSQYGARLAASGPWCTETGVGAVASSTLSAVGKHLSELDYTACEPLGTTVRGVVSSLFAERLNTGDDNAATGRQQLLLRIRSFAEQRLGDPDLTPTVLARRYNMSLRYLQIIFAELGTSPAKWIRDRRLDRIRSELSDPRFDHLTIANIGERSGLVGASHMSRLFRVKYGETPSSFRRARQRCPRREVGVTPGRAE